MGLSWRTKDGRVLTPKQMETDHIKNCLAMLKKAGYCSESNYINALGSAYSLQGEYAQMYAENEISNMKPTRMIDEFEEELEKRKRIYGS
jgi:hypothetical protein